MFQRVSRQALIDFTKNLAVMLKSGISINDALLTLASQARSHRFKRAIEKIGESVERGTPLAAAFAKEESLFGGIFVNLVRAGEHSGTLDENLSFLADWLERDNDIRSEMKAATLYPKVVFAATLLLGGALSIYILPKLIPLFTELGVDLPLSTRILLAIAVFLEHYWHWLAGGVIVFGAAISYLKKLHAVKRMLHPAYLRIPFVGRLLIAYQLALITQLFSTLLKSGMSMHESLASIKDAATNIAYRTSIARIQGRIERGTVLSEAMSDYPLLYPKNLISMIATGEKSGTIDNSFQFLADFYTKEVGRKTKKLPTIIEPLLLIAMTIIIGFIAISIMLPIYELSQGLSK